VSIRVLMQLLTNMNDQLGERGVVFERILLNVVAGCGDENCYQPRNKQAAAPRIVVQYCSAQAQFIHLDSFSTGTGSNFSSTVTAARQQCTSDGRRLRMRAGCCWRRGRMHAGSIACGTFSVRSFEIGQNVQLAVRLFGVL